MYSVVAKHIDGNNWINEYGAKSALYVSHFIEWELKYYSNHYRPTDIYSRVPRKYI